MTKPKIDDKLMEKARKEGVEIIPYSYIKEGRGYESTGYRIMVGTDIMHRCDTVFKVYRFCRTRNLRILNDEEGYNLGIRMSAQVRNRKMEECAQALNKHSTEWLTREEGRKRKIRCTNYCCDYSPNGKNNIPIEEFRENMLNCFKIWKEKNGLKEFDSFALRAVMAEAMEINGDANG